MSIKKASTLIISSALETRLNQFDYNVLLLQRSKNMRSWPGVHVFPGGKLDENIDNNSKWFEVLCNSEQKLTIRDDPSLIRHFFKGFINNKTIGQHFDLKNSELPSEISYRICAIRETFEETGQ